MGVGAHVCDRRFDSACCTVGGPHTRHFCLDSKELENKNTTFQKLDVSILRWGFFVLVAAGEKMIRVLDWRGFCCQLTLIKYLSLKGSMLIHNLCKIYCHDFWGVVTIDGWEMDLLTTCMHHLECYPLQITDAHRLMTTGYYSLH
jgi:hypothetical protein